MANANPYYVEPLGGLDVGAKLTQVLEGGRQQAKLKEWESTAPQILQSGDPAQIQQLMLKFPEMTPTIEKAMGLSPRSSDGLAQWSRDTLTTGEPDVNRLGGIIQEMQQRGENVAGPMQLLQKIQQNPEYAIEGAQKVLAWKDPKGLETFKKITEGEKPTPTSPTDVSSYVSLRNQESIDLTGEPLSAKDKADAMLEYKRKQAEETRATRLAERLVDAETASKIEYNKRFGTDMAVIENAAKVIEAKGEVTPQQKKALGKAGVAGKLATMTQYYADLDSMGAIVSSENNTIENIVASSKASPAGQYGARIIGSKAQDIRDSINAMKPLLLNDIRQSTDMGARGLDSEKELQFYMQAATDERRSIQSNMAAIIALDDAYGTGKVSAKLREKFNISPSEIDTIKATGAEILSGRGAEQIAPSEMSDEDILKQLGM